MMTIQQSYKLFADFHQFLVRDSLASWDDLPDRWTRDAIASRFVQGAGYVAIGTARDLYVPVDVRVFETEPGAAENPDGMAVGRLELPSGQLVVMGITDNEASGGRISLPAGTYGVRVLFYGLSTLTADGLSGDDRYVIELWPAHSS